MALSALAADLDVIAGGGIAAPLNEIAARFESSTGHKAVIRYGTAPELVKMANGGPFDAAVVPVEVVKNDAARAKFPAGALREVARVGMGVAVRAGAPKPDIATPEALKRTLLDARSIASIPESATGHLLAQIYEQLGIAGEMKARVKPQPTPARIAQSVASGEAELGVFLTNVLTAPGVELVGPFPPQLQREVVYTAGVAAAAKEADVAQKFIAYLSGPEAAAVIRSKGMTPGLASAQVRVLISGGFSGPYEKVLPDFERSTGVKVSTGSGASQGSGPQTIRAQLDRGVPADLVIMSREGLGELIAARLVAAGTDVDLARTPLGVAVRAGAAKPDVRTVEAFRQVLLEARLVAVPGSTSGIFFQKEILPKLGIDNTVKVKATPRGTGAAALVASGEADMAVMPVSEIVHAPGVELAGVLAEDIQLNQIFAAAVVAAAREPEGAKKLIAFLASPQAAAAIKAGGMEPLGKRQP